MICLTMLFLFRRNDNGAFVLSDICNNESSQPEWLEYVSASFMSAANGTAGDIGAKRQVSPRTTKWRFINVVFRMFLRLGISRSDLVMGMAHSEHSTRTTRVCRVAPSLQPNALLPKHNSLTTLPCDGSPPLGCRERKHQPCALALAQRSVRVDPYSKSYGGYSS